MNLIDLRHGALAIALAASLAACGGNDKAAEQPAAEPATTAETSTAAAPATETAAALPTECDAYIKTVEQCVSKLSTSNTAVADSVKQSLDTTRSAWSQVSDKSTLAASCKQVSDQFAASAKSMGC